MEESLLGRGERPRQHSRTRILKNDFNATGSLLCYRVIAYLRKVEELLNNKKNLTEIINKSKKIIKQEGEKLRKELKKINVDINSVNEYFDTAATEFVKYNKGREVKEGIDSSSINAIALQIFMEAGGDIDKVNIEGETAISLSDRRS